MNNRELTSRELDGTIAEKIMGWKQHAFSNFPWQLVPPDCDSDLSSDDPALVLLGVPNYSTSMDDALAIVNTMWENGWQFALNILGDYPQWCASFSPKYSTVWTTACAETAPQAICYAALAVIDRAPIAITD